MMICSLRLQPFRQFSRAFAAVPRHQQQRREPNGPSVITEIPGPKTLEVIGKLRGNYQSMNNIQFAVNYEKSFGNYIVDADGNCLLDLHQQVASLPVGYNHPRIIEALTSDEFLSVSASRAAIGLYPSHDWAKMISDVLLRCAPPGMNTVQTQICGSCAVENAMKSVFLAHMEKERDGRPPSKEELDSVLQNREPGAVRHAFLSFQKSFHGRTMGALSLTRSKARHKLDLPAFPWPAAPFPLYRYPLSDFEAENLAQDDLCLAQVEELMEEEERNGGKIIGLIIEPIQAEGGDNHASDDFFRRLRNICSEHGVHFVVDEVQTGVGPTGKFWAHEHWCLDEPPDLVTFSKKMISGGYYLRTGRYIPSEPYLIMNTWLGEHQKLIILQAVLDIIDENNLLQQVQESGTVILNGLKELESLHPEIINRSRGRGTFIGFDCATTEDREKLITKARSRGINIAGSGNHTIRLRPALIFTPQHANIFLDKLSDVLRDF